MQPAEQPQMSVIDLLKFSDAKTLLEKGQVSDALPVLKQLANQYPHDSELQKLVSQYNPPAVNPAPPVATTYQPLPPPNPVFQAVPLPQPYPQPQARYQQQPYTQPQPYHQSLYQPPLYPQPQYSQPYYAPAPPVVVVNTAAGPGFLVRALWFIFIGAWLGFFWMYAGWFLCATIIGLPLGLLMLNSLPRVLTLRPKGQQTTVTYNQYGQVIVTTGNTQQHSFLVRSIYFLCVGWWASLMWCTFAYFMFLFILTIPVGILMLDRLPMVITLRRN